MVARGEGGFANARSTDKEYATLTPRVVADHLAGKVHAGPFRAR